MKRASYLGMLQIFNLNHACFAIVKAYGANVYLVGSALRKRDYRDDDVRCILPDEDYVPLFKGVRGPRMKARLAMMNAALSEWLVSRTGLPIDFQFQNRAEVNRLYKGPRLPLGIFPEEKQ